MKKYLILLILFILLGLRTMLFAETSNQDEMYFLLMSSPLIFLFLIFVLIDTLKSKLK
jgi:uncharacterized membrane protein YcfT